YTIAHHMNLFKKSQEYLLYALIAGLLTSMALISASVNLLSVVVTVGWLVFFMQKRVDTNYWPRLGPDKYIWIHVAIVGLGAIVISDIPTVKYRWEIINEVKWVWFLYSIAAALLYTQIESRKIVHILAYLVIPVAAYGIFQS